MENFLIDKAYVGMPQEHYADRIQVQERNATTQPGPHALSEKDV